MSKKKLISQYEKPVTTPFFGMQMNNIAQKWLILVPTLYLNSVSCLQTLHSQYNLLNCPLLAS